jgi:beta-lactamase superfamily II metal-dependent hydrolase
VTQSLNYIVLPAGQGTATLIEVIDDETDIPLTMIIIDLGSSNWEENLTGKFSADIIALRLNLMAKPTIDAIFLSHSDDDHVNMLGVLLEQFDKPTDSVPSTKKQLTINKVWYGGYDKGYGGILTYLEEYKPPKEATNLRILQKHASNLETPLYPNNNGIEIRLIIGNMVTEETQLYKSSHQRPYKDKHYLINTKSLVLLVTYGTAEKRHFVATGDATGLTMAACNEMLDKAKWKDPVLSISAPHHGSRATSYSLLNIKRPHTASLDVAKEVVKQFVLWLRPESVTVSAGETGYHHPSPALLNDLAEYVKDAARPKDKDSPLIWVDDEVKSDREHFYTAYFEEGAFTIAPKTKPDPNAMDVAATWPDQEGWWTARTTKAVYTIDYFTLRWKRYGLSAAPEIPTAFWPGTAKFEGSVGPYGAVPWSCGWEYAVKNGGTTVSLSRQYADAVPPRALGFEFLQIAGQQGSLAPERLAPVPAMPLAAPAPVLALVAVRAAVQPRGDTVARVPRPGRRRVRALQ